MPWSKPGVSLLQRLTFSAYYGSNVAKGGVFVQLCGWLGTFELWMGAVSDTEYLNNSGILKLQETFVAKDETYSHVSFLNIVDKGYRSILAAWRAGCQFLLQPIFAKSDEKFNTNDVLTSAEIAANRAGNECAVCVAKMSGMIKQGLQHGGSTKRLADLWLAWSFQANFMFKPVM